MKIIGIIQKVIITLVNNRTYQKILRKRGIKIGKDCEIYKNVIFGEEPYLITIGNHVRLTHGVKFITHDGGLWVPRFMGLIDRKSDKFGRIIIGNNVHVGWDVIILPNVTIGDNCIIGSGAVVTHDIPSNSVAVGVPARVIESIDEYVRKNKEKMLLTKGMSSVDKRKVLEKLNV